MCTNPISIYNRATFINECGSHLYQSVCCGSCVECQNQKYSDWLVRAYFHFKSICKDNKYAFGFTDTLTYNEEHLPVTYGIPHFSKRDIQLFLKRLRKNLEYDGYDVDKNLSYWLTSEYGGEKHRPHYHIMFFSRIPGLTVSGFKKTINKSWCDGTVHYKHNVYDWRGEPKYGRMGFTDSWYKNYDHTVRFHGDNDTSFFKALHYIGKYLHKDQDWQSVVNKKIYEIESSLSDLGEIASDALKEFNSDLKNMRPFQLQSKGFGRGFIENVFYDLEDMMNKLKVYIPDSIRMKSPHSIPMYYMRKLFYDMVPNGYMTNPDGSYVWSYRKKDYVMRYRYELNNLGLSFKRLQFDELEKKMINRYEDIIHNVGQYCDHIFNEKEMKVEFTPSSKILEKIDDFLDGRTVSDFVQYKMSYKGAILSSDYKEFYENVHLLDLSKYQDFYMMRHYGLMFENHFWDDDLYTRESFRQHFRKIAINQYHRDEWRYFDELDSLLNTLMYTKNYLKSEREVDRKKIISKLKKFIPDIGSDDISPYQFDYTVRTDLIGQALPKKPFIFM